jgi:sugar lactone lactonase YvrE
MAWGRPLTAATIIAAIAFASCAIAGPREGLAQFQSRMGDGAKAIVRKDFAGARKSYGDALRLMPQHPTAIYRLASADASLGKTAEAFTLLHRLAAMGLQLPASFDASFEALKAHPEFLTLKKEVARHTATLCLCTTIFDGPGKPFIAEGIAFDPGRHRLLISSVYQREIAVIAGDSMQDFSGPLPAGLSPFSITIDSKRDRVWVSASSLAQSHGATAAQRGHSALLALRLNDGAFVANIAGPSGTDLGDTALAPDGTVYVTDSRSGGVYRLKAGGTKLEPVTTGLSSAQGIAISRDNRTALIADYALGLMRLDLSTGKLTAIAVPDLVTTLGIDGLAALIDGSFVATQNGIAPARIVRFRLSSDWSRVAKFDVVARNAASIADPSLLAVSGNDVYVVGVSQWASFDEDVSEPVRPVPAFRIVRLSPL